MSYYMGVDLGADGLRVVLIDEANDLVGQWVGRVKGEPILALQKMMGQVFREYPVQEIARVGVTGSGYHLLNAVLGADYKQNGIECLSKFLQEKMPRVKTVVQIGYQETAVLSVDEPAKRKGKKNECVRGLGAFWQGQMEAMGLDVGDWDRLAQEAVGSLEVRISAKCPLYMARDVVEKQQWGYLQGAVIRGINEAIVRCFMQNTAKAYQFTEDVEADVLFIGNASKSQSLCQALAKFCGGQRVVTGADEQVYYAWAIAGLAKDQGDGAGKWRGEQILTDQYAHDFRQCDGCENQCALTDFMINGEIKGVWGGRCDKWHELA